MKQLERLALVVGAAALFGLVGFGTASATILTSPAGTKVPAEQIFQGEKDEGAAAGRFENAFGSNVECTGSTFEGKVAVPGDATTTVEVKLNAWTLTGCNCEVVVLKSGTLIVHTEGAVSNANGKVTGTDQQFTTNCFGFHCIWATGNTNMGVLTAGSPAKMVWQAVFTRTGGSSGAFCGGTGTLNFNYKITFPTKLSVD